MARKTKEDTERTYHSLLDAATQLFIRQGVVRTTLGQIATEAGLTRGAVYWHFDNKDDVIRALWQRNALWLDHAFDNFTKRLSNTAPAASFRTAVKAIIHDIVDRLELAQVIRIVMHAVELSDEKTELHHFLLAKKHMVYSAFAEGFRRLQQHGALRENVGPPELLATCLLSYTHGLINSHLSADESKIDLRQDGGTALDYFFNSVLKD